MKINQTYAGLRHRIPQATHGAGQLRTEDGRNGVEHMSGLALLAAFPAK